MFRGKHSKGLARFGLPKGAMLLYIDDLYLSTTEECLGGEPSFTHVFWFSVQTASTIASMPSSAGKSKITWITSLKLGLPATITHVIDAHSPLYDLSLGQMEAAEMELLCFMSGTDPMTSNLLQSRHSYTPADIRVNERFVGINLQTNARGKLGLDFTNFDHTVPTEQGPVCSLPIAAAGSACPPYRHPIPVS
ncbi:uncharacterized protein HaLaN_04730 [Haematococcus lacustris]|uniref:Inward rectifier potassium channel C-terminal domain-containing protein n=1 Tax=Haematococcus lacustris TaxID=44745 RepID=A0A699YH88_HAELA|nr:uncharacterized protein HaLaN_04730 [Haematococcus lacustris]